MDGIGRQSPRYRTTLDRAGLALGAGGGLGGLAAMLLTLAGGARDPVALALVAATGAALTLLLTTVLGTPFWLLLHRAGHCRAWHAALLGAVVAFLICTGALTDGFGLAMPADGSAPVRWASALATGALFAFPAAGIAAVMWRVAYRPA